jgi:hypothetical protein
MAGSSPRRIRPRGKWALSPWQIAAIVAVFFVPVVGDVLALALFLKWSALR